jgi:hypothetical protein
MYTKNEESTSSRVPIGSMENEKGKAILTREVLVHSVVPISLDFRSRIQVSWCTGCEPILHINARN